MTESGITTRFRYVGISNAVAQEVNDGTGAVIVSHATDAAGTILFDFLGTTVSRYYGRNDHNDVVWTSSSTGAVNATAAYDPFGNLVASTGTLPATRWQSSWQDAATGLYYVIARWYAPTLGRFLSNDPLAGSPSRPQSQNPYAYVQGSPVNGIDPSGMCTVDSSNYDACGNNFSATLAAIATGGGNKCLLTNFHADGCTSSAPVYKCNPLGTYLSCGAVSSASPELQSASDIVAGGAAALRAEAAAEEARRKWQRDRSMTKYKDILRFMVKQIQAHAKGQGTDGNDAGFFHNCYSCDSWVGLGALAATALLGPLAPLNQGIAANDAATAMTYGTMFASYPCSDGIWSKWAKLMGLACGTWDDKYALTAERHFFARETSTYNWTLIPGEDPDTLLLYTIWGNIDFTFTGRAWGLGRDQIEEGLQRAPSGTAGSFMEPANIAGREAGYRLWERVGGANNLTESALDSVIRQNLRTYRSDRVELAKPFDGQYWTLNWQ